VEYIYKNKDGERIILNFPIGKAPSKKTIDGVQYKRDLDAELSGKSFCLKGGGWPSQDAKRKEQMTQNNVAAGRRTKSTWGDPKKVVPNYKGEVCDSWDEASNLADKDEDKE